MPPDEPTDEEKLEELPQDTQTPFRPADAPRDLSLPPDDPGQMQASQLDDTHQVTDTNLDPAEEYDEGIAGAAEANEPNAGNAVTGYTPPAPSKGETDGGGGPAMPSSGQTS